MSMLSDQLYGPSGQQQPSPLAAQAVGAGQLPPGATGDSGVRTQPRPPAGPISNPTLALVILLGVAALLVNFSVKGSISVKG